MQDTQTRRPRRALDNPAFSAGKEVHSDDFQVGQLPDIDADNPGERIIESVGADVLHDGYAEALAFGEEPVTIVINQANVHVDNPPSHIQCSVQGRGAEVLMNGKFVAVGWLPIGSAFTTKRKYLEVLLASKQASIRTDVIKASGKDPVNKIKRQNAVTYPVSIVKDANPKGMEWMMRMLAEA